MLKTLKDFNFQGKRVFVRCDFNVPIKEGKVLDDFKIQKTLQTIRYLRDNGAKIILSSHLGWPQEIKQKKERLKRYSLRPVKERLERLLGEKIRFSKDVLGNKPKKEIKKLKPGQILLLENLRFEKGEEKNDEEFTKSLAELGEVYINDAFPSCHRNHASVVGLPKLLPHFAGFSLKEEIEALVKVKENPEKPLVVIIGGVKISSKIEVIEEFLGKADHLLFGGKIANIILRVKGICIGRPWPAEDVVQKINKMSLTDPKFHLPVDVIVSPDKTGEIYTRQTGPGNIRKEESIFDIGPETIRNFINIIKEGKTIVWSGALGMAENENFRRGTEEVARAITRNHQAFSLVGGGDTVSLVKEFDLRDKFSHVSTGGSAMLAFLAGESLPGIEALK